MKNFKVLVVDDDPITCRLLETVLQMENYQTASALTIEQKDVISLLNQEKPDIVVLDYHLGSEETLSYLTTIRAAPDWSQVPVLMTSAIDLEWNCVQAGASGFILKPFDWGQMTNAVNKLRDKLLT